MPDYSKPNPTLLEKLKTASDGEIAEYLKNAKAKLPDAQWFVDAIITEQVNRGGFRNMTADSVRAKSSNTGGSIDKRRQPWRPDR